MAISFHINHKQFVSGITLKNGQANEENNMALHITNQPEGIIANRQVLADTLETKVNNFVCSEQTHSDNFCKVTNNDRGHGAVNMAKAIPNTDALYTSDPGIVLCTFTADCVPVTFYDRKKQIIGVIHSGWQGTVKEISRKIFQHLIQHEQCQPEDIYVHLGPALSQAKFEVDRDVYEKYLQLGYAEEFMYLNDETNKYHIDNQKTVKKQCELVGIPSDQISQDTTCTFTSPNHFSYREDRQTGRHLSFIMKKNNPDS